MDKTLKIRRTGVANQDLISTGIQTKIQFESPNKVEFESDRFRNINQSAQYYREKIENSKYRLYGSISQIINLDTDDRIQNNPKFEELDIDNGHWTVSLFRPTNSQFANQQFGQKLIKADYQGRQYEFDLNNGLPLFQIKSKKISGRFRVGFTSIFNHNLVVDDIIKITTTNLLIESGNYRILGVDGNNFYINKTTESDIIASEFSVSISPQLNLENLSLPVSDVSFLSDVNNPLFVLNTQVYFKKMDNGVTCDYYIKELELFYEFDSVHKQAYSQNIYNQKSILFSDRDYHDISGSTNNRNEPLDKFYIGIVKKQSTNNLSAIESNFENIITRTQPYQGLETIIDVPVGVIADNSSITNQMASLINRNTGGIYTTQSAFSVSGQPSLNSSIINRFNTVRINQTTFKRAIEVGDILKHSICEFNSQTLQETELLYVHHTFLVNGNIRFTYNPFYEVELRKFSEYIETSDLTNDIPTYAQYNEQYQKYLWRVPLNIGFFEGENGLELPYLNGCYYINKNIIFNLKNHSSYIYNLDGTIGSLNENLFGDLFVTEDNVEDFVVYMGNPNC